MRLLGIDYGTVTTGFAIGENSAILPLGFLRTKDQHTLKEHIKKIIEAERIDKIILGVPKHNNPVQQQKIENFTEVLKKEVNISVELIDESNTSKESFREEFTKHSNIKKIRKIIHAKSAEKILERYFLENKKS